MYRKSGARNDKKKVGPVIEFRTGIGWDGIGDKSQSVVMVVPSSIGVITACKRACVRLSVAGPAGGGRDEKSEGIIVFLLLYYMLHFSWLCCVGGGDEEEG